MTVEEKIALNKFQPRDYQRNLMNAIDSGKYKRALAVWPRRAGKDVVCFNLLLKAALKRVGVYYYCLPTFRQARLVIWDSITNDGKRILEYVPKEFIANINHNEMKIKLHNGSLIQLIGSDTYDTSLVGTNPRMVVFSEYALSDPRAYQLVRPILNANEGTAILVSTPRGKNNLWEMYNIAKQHPDWFCEILTVNETKHINMHEIQKEIISGEISEDLAKQEYFCSFEQGVEGSFYIKYIDKARLDGRIGQVPHETSMKVFTVWDLGYSDETTIIFYQSNGNIVRLIDCYSNRKQGLEHYINVVKNKPYIYGAHIAPHDIAVHEWGSGFSRIEMAHQLGIEFTIANKVEIMDGIEAVRATFSKLWIDERNCAPLLKALENYRQEWDNDKKIYKSKPRHDENSHFADAMRYLCVSLSKTADSMSPEDVDRLYNEAKYGTQTNLPPIFRDNLQSFR